MPTWIEIATSWSLVSLLVGLGGYYYYTSTQPPSSRRSSLSRATQPLPSTTTKKDKPKKSKTKQVLDNAKETIKDTLPSTGHVTGADVPAQPQKKHKKNISEDDKTFAQALQKQQVGTSFGAGQQLKQKPRTQKQGKAMEKEVEVLHVGGTAAQKVTNSKDEVLEPYGDAVTNDEPVSPVEDTPIESEHETIPETSFPALNESYGGNSGVDDMLEEAAPGPSVLRMTAPKEQWSTVSKKKTSKPSTNTNNTSTTTTNANANVRSTEETKKQRQARQRREAEKAVIAESEAVRRQLEEKQRRTAREARGEPSRNGESIAKNAAWKGANGGANAGVGAKQQALFDTFEMEAP